MIRVLRRYLTLLAAIVVTSCGGEKIAIAGQLFYSNMSGCVATRWS